MRDLTRHSHLDECMRTFRLQAKKSLGQNFLTTRSVIEDIVVAAELAPNGLVVEVGPGMGVLTMELVQHAGEVVAIELDDDVIPALEDNVAAVEKEGLRRADFSLVHEDIRDATLPSRPYKVIANIPYYLTDRIIRRFLEDAPMRPSLMVLMVQKEVAEKIVAPNGKESIPSIACKVYGDADIVTIVDRHDFLPVPKVDSAILRIRTHTEPRINFEGDFSEKYFFRIVRAGFGMKRKTLINALVGNLALDKENVQTILTEASIDPSRRAETLTVEEWSTLATIFFRHADL